MSDPFASVQVSTPGAIPSQKGAADPFQGAAAHDSADPFGTSSEVRGEFTPTPTMDAMAGRLVVMIPRSFDPHAKDPNDPAGVKTRELYTVDTYILTGGRMSWYYTVKGDPEKGTQDELKEFVVENVTPEDPYVSKGMWVPQGNIIRGLKEMHRQGRIFLGVPTMVPTKADRDKGMTAAQVQARHLNWVNAGKPGNRPASAWALVDPDAAQRAIAVAWWNRAKGDIAPVIPADI